MAGPSLADRYRAHREAFTLALELGITPREAEIEIRRRQARLRWLAGEQRWQARERAPLTVLRSLDRLGTGGPQGERDPEPWMMRD